MSATTPRSRSFRLFSAAVLAGLMAVSALPVGAEDDEDDSGIGMDALAGLTEGVGGDTSDGAATGNLDDPLGGGTGAAQGEPATEVTGTEPGTSDGVDPADPAAADTNPMFRLMLDLILEDVQAREAEARAAGRTLSEAERSAIVTTSVQRLIADLQKIGLLGDVDTRELLQQIESIPADPEE